MSFIIIICGIVIASMEISSKVATKEASNIFIRLGEMGLFFDNPIDLLQELIDLEKEKRSILHYVPVVNVFLAKYQTKNEMDNLMKRIAKNNRLVWMNEEEKETFQAINTKEEKIHYIRYNLPCHYLVSRRYSGNPQGIPLRKTNAGKQSDEKSKDDYCNSSEKGNTNRKSMDIPADVTFIEEKREKILTKRMKRKY